MGFADLHSHVLPQLDDGSKALDESLQMLKLLHEMGFDLVCATPHQKLGTLNPERTRIDSTYEVLRAQSPVELHLGAENFWDEQFLERCRTHAQPTYTGGKAFLVEINVQVAPPHMAESLFQIRVGGLLPVLAHPERYATFWETPEKLEAIGRTAALVIDLAALDGAHGAQQCKAAQRLVLSGIAHAAASDIHSPNDARAVGAGIAWIKKKLGAGAVRRLLEDNPRTILTGALPD